VKDGDIIYHTTAGRLVRPWIGRRNQYGAYHSLIQELSAEDPNGLKNFLRMDMASFNELLEMVTPLIKRRVTSIFFGCILGARNFVIR
jgi:hypothetical protein